MTEDLTPGSKNWRKWESETLSEEIRSGQQIASGNETTGGIFETMKENAGFSSSLSCSNIPLLITNHSFHPGN